MFKDFYGNFCVENLGAIWNINKFENIFCRWITGFSDIYLGCIKLLIKINDNKLQRFDLKVHNLLCLKQNIYESLRIMVELKQDRKNSRISLSVRDLNNIFLKLEC